MPKKKAKPPISFVTLLTLGLIVIFFTVIYFSLPWGQTARARAGWVQRPPQAVACTMDAKECPDGSYVGRVAPRCDWAPCPVAVGVPAETGVDLAALGGTVRSLIVAEHPGATIRTVTISQATQTHARGNVTFEPTAEERSYGWTGSGGYFLVAKVDGQWQLVLDGNGSIPCRTVERYGFPSGMVADCAS